MAKILFVVIQSPFHRHHSITVIKSLLYFFLDTLR